MLHEDRARLWVMHNDTPNLYLSKVKGVTLQPVGANKLEQVYLEE
jgi:hypothetical protein